MSDSGIRQWQEIVADIKSGALNEASVTQLLAQMPYATFGSLHTVASELAVRSYADSNHARLVVASILSPDRAQLMTAPATKARKQETDFLLQSGDRIYANQEGQMVASVVQAYAMGRSTIGAPLPLELLWMRLPSVVGQADKVATEMRLGVSMPDELLYIAPPKVLVIGTPMENWAIVAGKPSYALTAGISQDMIAFWEQRMAGVETEDSSVRLATALETSLTIAKALELGVFNAPRPSEDLYKQLLPPKLPERERRTSEV